MEPRHAIWLIPRRLAVSPRPGGGGRSHRRDLRVLEMAWWRSQGITCVISCMGARHGLLECALEGLAVRWFPLDDPATAPAAITAAAGEVRTLLRDPRQIVLVHGDVPGEWFSALRAGLMLLLGLADSAEDALGVVEASGLPVGSLAREVVGGIAISGRAGVAA